MSVKRQHACAASTILRNLTCTKRNAVLMASDAKYLATSAALVADRRVPDLVVSELIESWLAVAPHLVLEAQPSLLDDVRARQRAKSSSSGAPQGLTDDGVQAGARAVFNVATWLLSPLRHGIESSVRIDAANVIAGCCSGVARNEFYIAEAFPRLLPRITDMLQSDEDDECGAALLGGLRAHQISSKRSSSSSKLSASPLAPPSPCKTLQKLPPIAHSCSRTKTRSYTTP